jgi:hypothetical protein
MLCLILGVLLAQVGCQVLKANSFEAPCPHSGTNRVAGNYKYSICILDFLYDPASPVKSKSYIAIAKAITVNISANVIQWLITLPAADLPDDEHRGYLKLVKRHVLENSFYLMLEDIDRDSENGNRKKSYN